MKTLKKNIFSFYYHSVMDSVSENEAFENTIENKINIGLTILCQLYEKKGMTEKHLKNYFNELGDFFTYEDLDKNFGHFIRNIHPSIIMIFADCWRGKKMNSMTLKEIFRDLSDFCFEKDDIASRDNLEFISNVYDVMQRENIKMIKNIIDFRSFAA